MFIYYIYNVIINLKAENKYSGLGMLTSRLSKGRTLFLWVSEKKELSRDEWD